MNMKTNSKFLIVSLFLVLFTVTALFSFIPVTTLTNGTPMKVTQVSQTGHTVLFSETHTALGSATLIPGNASFFAWILEEHGYETEMNFDQQLDSGILAGVDILVLFFPMVALTSGEVTAVNNFVQAGGGLLLVGTDNSPSWHFSSVNLNAISQTYGITFNTGTEDSWTAIATDMITHPVTQDVSSIHSNVDFKLKGTTLTVESPATTIIENNGDPVAAVSEYGSGKVVSVGAVAPFIMYRTVKHWQVENDDLFQFSLNIADWLVGISPRKVIVPEVAVIPVGPGPALTPTEIEDYKTYNGIIHDHTSHSDGADTPADMLWAGASRGLDYMLVTDHSYEAPSPLGLGGVTGAQAMRAIAERYDIDIEIFVGAELSRGHHSLAFPLTENIYTNTQAGMVAGAHGQGAIVSLCHPTISAPYMETYELYESYGYDAIEVTNTGFSHGLWDEGYSKSFYGGSDGHSFEWVGKIENVLFVDHPTGLDGRLSVADVVDAILEKRVVVLDKATNVVYGQQVWIDRYFELMDLAATEIANAAVIVNSVEGEGITLAELYLEDAEIAYDFGSPHRAFYAASNASASEALNITINVVSPDPRFLLPSTNYNLTLNITSTNSDAIQFNMTRYWVRAFSAGPSTDIIVAPASGYTNWTTNITTPIVGYSAIIFNLHDFNTTSNMATLIYGVGALVNVGGARQDIERNENGTLVTMVYSIARGDSRYISSAIGFFNDGSGVQNKSISIRTVTLEATIGPYLRGTVINYSAIVYDIFGGVFVLPEAQYTVTTDPLEPTTPTFTTGTAPPVEIDPVLLVGAAGGVIAVMIVVVFLRKRRGGM